MLVKFLEIDLEDLKFLQTKGTEILLVHNLQMGRKKH